MKSQMLGSYQIGNLFPTTGTFCPVVFFRNYGPKSDALESRSLVLPIDKVAPVNADVPSNVAQLRGQITASITDVRSVLSKIDSLDEADSNLFHGLSDVFNLSSYLCQVRRLTGAGAGATSIAHMPQLGFEGEEIRRRAYFNSTKDKQSGKPQLVLVDIWNGVPSFHPMANSLHELDFDDDTVFTVRSSNLEAARTLIELQDKPEEAFTVAIWIANSISFSSPRIEAFPGRTIEQVEDVLGLTSQYLIEGSANEDLPVEVNTDRPLVSTSVADHVVEFSDNGIY